MVGRFHLLQCQKCGHGGRDGAHVVDARAVDIVLAVGDYGEVAVVVLASEGVEGSFDGEEGRVEFEVEVVDEGAGLSLHCNGDNDVGDRHD